MHLEVVAPSPALAQYVEYYGLWEDEQDDAQEVAPEKIPAVAAGDKKLYAKGFQKIESYGASSGKAEIVGLVTWQLLSLRQTGQPGGLGIYFRPAGFFHLFGVTMSAADTSQDAGQRAGQFTRELMERLGQIETPRQWLAATDELLLRQLRGQRPVPDTIDLVASRILHEHGQVNIETLAHEAGLSRRQLERRFLTEVGAPPKLYARIARFNHVLQLLATHPAPSWQDIAFHCGYYDQAHFIREFRFFTGKSPGAYSLSISDLMRRDWTL